MNKRVVVTGLGVLAANGIGVDEFWRTLLAGESGIGPITLFDPSEHRIKLAGEVKGFDLTEQVPFPVKPRRMGRHAQFALATAWMALKDANLYPAVDTLAPCDLSLVVGVSTSSMDIAEAASLQCYSRGPNGVSPSFVGSSQPQGVANVLARELKVISKATTISTACAAGCDAIGMAYQMLHDARSDVVLVGGTDAPITAVTLGGFGMTGMIPQWGGDPGKASRPFDMQRKGGFVGEGSGFFIMETLEHALARGANPYLEVLGYGSSVDLANAPVCSGLDVAIQEALSNARTCPGDIDYVCAHGPSDPEIDLNEARVIQRCIGEGNPRVLISSIKGHTGNPLSAAGPLQLANCAMVFKHNCIPPTANCENVDPDCVGDIVRGEPRRAVVNRALINVHGMGGVNSCLVVKRI